MHTRGMGLFISLCVLIVVLAGCATTPGALPSGKTEAGEGTRRDSRRADCPERGLPGNHSHHHNAAGLKIPRPAASRRILCKRRRDDFGTV